jgi:hypothetical protein
MPMVSVPLAGLALAGALAADEADAAEPEAEDGDELEEHAARPATASTARLIPPRRPSG